MGLDARLVATIGGDAAAQRILEYLRSSGVSTDLIKEAPDARTPVTGVLVSKAGNSSVTGWKNEDDATRNTAELRSLLPALHEANAVVITWSLL